ncbi:hypothetical protein B0H34DRAFT_827016 [Crassisporium funariophilum]|nr:hypothetical protein B0H34DRAFT_827016 [Crassisporium funariophilum]
MHQQVVERNSTAKQASKSNQKTISFPNGVRKQTQGSYCASLPPLILSPIGNEERLSARHSALELIRGRRDRVPSFTLRTGTPGSQGSVVRLGRRKRKIGDHFRFRARPNAYLVEIGSKSVDNDYPGRPARRQINEYAQSNEDGSGGRVMGMEEIDVFRRKWNTGYLINSTKAQLQ